MIYFGQELGEGVWMKRDLVETAVLDIRLLVGGYSETVEQQWEME